MRKNSSSRYCQQTHEEDECFSYVCQQTRDGAEFAAPLSHELSTLSFLQPFYCDSCGRAFKDANSFLNHVASKRHAKPFIFCPRCKFGFVSAAGLAKHVEMSSCYNHVSNKQIVDAVRRWEQESGNPNLFTVPRIGWHNNDENIISSRTYATAASFDGNSYVCPICGRGFGMLGSLNQHLNSNVHEAAEFHCRKCSKKFKELSALIAHVESEACGAIAAPAVRGFIDSFKTLYLTN